MNPKAPKAPKKASPQLSHQLWGQVAVHCDIDTLPALFRVNRDTRLCFSEVEEKKIFKLHFPHYLEKEEALGKEEKKEDAAHPHRTLEKLKAARKKDYKHLVESQKKLLDSVKCGQLDEVKKRITDHSDAKYFATTLVESNRRSLCYWAKRNNNQAANNYIYELIKIFFRLSRNQKLDVVRQDEQRHTLLSWAIICFQSAEVLDDLVKQGADINHTWYERPFIGNGAVTQIKLAIRFGNYDAFVFLYHQIGIRCNNQQLLLEAAYFGHHNIVKYLVEEQKASPSHEEMKNAVCGKNIPVIKYFLDTNIELLTDEILKAAVDEEVIEYLSERKSPEYKIAKENLRNEIQKLPENSLLQTAANTFLTEIMSSEKTSVAEIKLLTTTLDQTTLLLRNINQGTMTKEAIDDYITQANAHGANLPSLKLTNVLVVLSFLFVIPYMVALMAKAYLLAVLFVNVGASIGLVGGYTNHLYFRKLSADPRGQNLPLYATLSKSMKKIGQASQTLLNQSLFTPKPCLTIQAGTPPESKRGVAPANTSTS